MLGNSYDNRSYPSGDGYHYSNACVLCFVNCQGSFPDSAYSNGSYYYNNPNGSTYYNSGKAAFPCPLLGEKCDLARISPESIG